jgi:hypothetical protein
MWSLLVAAARGDRGSAVVLEDWSRGAEVTWSGEPSHWRLTHGPARWSVPEASARRVVGGPKVDRSPPGKEHR